MTHVKKMLLGALSFCLLLKLTSSEKLNDESINLVPGQQLLRTIPPDVSIELITSDIPIKYRYALFQAHSQIYSLILSFTNDVMTHGSHIESNNAGLIKLLGLRETSTHVFLRSNAPEPVNVYLGVELYTHSDPIPGGCNMEFDVETSPFLRVSYNAFITKIAYQPGSLGYKRGEVPKSCDVSYTSMDYDFYVYHLTEGNLEESDYFKAISIMMDLNRMKNEAKKVSPLFAMSRMTYAVTTYRRQGMVFNVVVRNKSDSAPYVPGVTYGCKLLGDTDSCADLLKPFEWLLAIVGALLGVFLCFFGHRFFKTALASFGFITTAMIIYIILIRWATMSYPATVAITLLVGVIGAFGWAFTWWLYGSPLVAVLLPGFDLGFLCGCILMFTPLGDLQLFQNDANYWLLIGCCVLLVSIILISFTKLLHILSCTVIGSYAAIFLIDYFIDGSLRYILIDVIRRATIPNYNNVINVIAYQTCDIILTIAWALLIIIATIFQHIRERGRPPFPFSEYRIRKLIRLELLQQQQEPETDPLLPNNSSITNPNYSRGRYQSIVF
uniref:TM7S3/TM198-like domain-containing protein n=1 Tax=Strigamia maritima TaxID=126957 RepID=T1IRJ0_STRMM